MTTASTSYLALLRLPGATAFFTAACAGRLGTAMASLGLVWLLHDATGSFAAAGAVVGAFAVAEALVSPQVARVIDACGQVRVVPVLVIVHAASMAVVITTAGTQGSATVTIFAAAVIAGASIPQLGALSAARWVHLLDRCTQSPAAAVVPAAFALESVANAGAYLAGPVAVSAVAAAGHPALGSATAAALVLSSGVLLAVRRDTAPPPAATSHRSSGAAGRGRARGARLPAAAAPRRRLVSAAFVVLVVIQLGMGAYFGAVQVSISAFAVQAGRPAAASTLFAVSSMAGLVAAWAYGRRTWKAGHQRQLAIAATALAVSSALMLLAGGLVWLGLALAAAGAMVPVVLVASSVLTQARVPRAALTQAFTWLSSASAAGSAGATTVAGAAIDATGARGGLAVASAATAAVAALVLGTRRALSGSLEPATAHDSDPGGGDPAGQAGR